MRYYSVKFNILQAEEIIKTETLGIESEQALTAETLHSILIEKMKLTPDLSLEVTDKIDIGEPDFLRLEKRSRL